MKSTDWITGQLCQNMKFYELLLVLTSIVEYHIFFVCEPKLLLRKLLQRREKNIIILSYLWLRVKSQRSKFIGSAGQSNNSFEMTMAATSFLTMMW